jgi:hypothetical protein
MSYYEASRKVRMQGGEALQMPKEKLLEAPWIPRESVQAVAVAMAGILSYYEASRKARMQGGEAVQMPKEKLYETAWMPWESVQAATERMGATEIPMPL